MQINDWKTKDITFHASERWKVTKHVHRLILLGWYLQQGFFDENGLIRGDESDSNPECEDIQLNYTFNLK